MRIRSIHRTRVWICLNWRASPSSANTIRKQAARIYGNDAVNYLINTLNEISEHHTRRFTTLNDFRQTIHDVDILSCSQIGAISDVSVVYEELTERKGERMDLSMGTLFYESL